ncbi:hypothetical protein Lsan_1132 [Legionella santicrucis]|uniref:Transmembrane protein n=1 Tax=Legionella santicrucis TaxID=45074 RepID=A0A0W0Z4J3_9GAMM|nr:hypothetical protein [Legionella santicrucis]KTD63699.1 hypothetical protein Lsan_1132 [Legionella santicrucis]
MLGILSIRERFSAVIASFVLAIVALFINFNLSFSPHYTDFIVGNITWGAQTKLQDLIAVPLFITVLFLGFLLLQLALAKQKHIFGNEYTNKLASQFLWWSLPSIISLSSLFLGKSMDKQLIYLSAVGIIVLGVSVSYHTWKNVETNPLVISLCMLMVFLIGFFPIETALLLGRFSVVSNVNLDYYVKIMHIIWGVGTLFMMLYSIKYPKKLNQLLTQLVFIGQIGLPILFLTLYPANLLKPDGALTHYQTQISLKILVLIMVIWGIYDVVNRYCKYKYTSEDWLNIFSPVAFFALFLGFKIGITSAPLINPDDYHFGEKLLGWWSYMKGSLPYVDYIPSHGLIDDDLGAFISYFFYDGSAASISEASRLGFAILSFFAYMSLYLYSRSIPLALVSCYFAGIRFSWLFLTPFICLWFSEFLRKKPENWLSVWILTAPFLILGVPPQGFILAAASGIMVLYFTWILLVHSKKVRWKNIILSLLFLAILGLTTSLIPLLKAAIQYVIENGAINQEAYGIPWVSSWNMESGSFLLELIRNSWILILMGALLLMYSSTKNKELRESVLLPSMVTLLFFVLLIPYAMGRIDPQAISRPGLVSIFGWSIFIPVLTWSLIKPYNRVLLILVVASMGALEYGSSISLNAFISAATSKVPTGLLRDGPSSGLPNVGYAFVENEHWERLIKLNDLLNKKLAPNETYLDLTSRNAQYYYLNRKPVVAITAPYNMVSPYQQKRITAHLSLNPPKVVLIEGANIIHDGGGLALRNPYLYRFVVDNYLPRYENGFIIGDLKTDNKNQHTPLIDVELKNFTDVNWERGVNRNNAAVIIDNPFLITLLKIGTKVRVSSNDVRSITNISPENNTIWFDGPVFDPTQIGYPHRIEIENDTQFDQDYRNLLFEKAFAHPDLHKIPVAWGNSENTLKKKMNLVKKFDNITPSLYEMSVTKNGYEITGADPQLIFDISGYSVSGHNAGLLRLNFSCVDRQGEPRLQIFWWGDKEGGPSETASIKFTADDGVLIIPLDSSSRWLTLNQIKGIRIDLDNAVACKAITVNNVGLYQRNFNLL